MLNSEENIDDDQTISKIFLGIIEASVLEERFSVEKVLY